MGTKASPADIKDCIRVLGVVPWAVGQAPAGGHLSVDRAGDALREDPGKALLASVTFLPVPSQDPGLCSKMTQLPEGWAGCRQAEGGNSPPVCPQAPSAWGPGWELVEAGCESLTPGSWLCVTWSSQFSIFILSFLHIETP